MVTAAIKPESKTSNIQYSLREPFTGTVQTCWQGNVLKFWQALCELDQQDDLVRVLSELGIAETLKTPHLPLKHSSAKYCLTHILQA